MSTYDMQWHLAHAEPQCSCCGETFDFPQSAKAVKAPGPSMITDNATGLIVENHLLAFDAVHPPPSMPNPERQH